MTLSLIEHQITKAAWKSNLSISGVSSDIFINVETFSVFSLALIFVLIRFCLLKPLSVNAVRAMVSNLETGRAFH
jgi:hypothetical protein